METERQWNKTLGSRRKGRKIRKKEKGKVFITEFSSKEKFSKNDSIPLLQKIAK